MELLKRTLRQAIDSDDDVSIQAWRVLSTLARYQTEWRASQEANDYGTYGRPTFRIGLADYPPLGAGTGGTLDEAIVKAAQQFLAS